MRLKSRRYDAFFAKGARPARALVHQYVAASALLIGYFAGPSHLEAFFRP
jgi:hypothetical protein